MCLSNGISHPYFHEAFSQLFGRDGNDYTRRRAEITRRSSGSGELSRLWEGENASVCARFGIDLGLEHPIFHRAWPQNLQ